MTCSSRRADRPPALVPALWNNQTHKKANRTTLPDSCRNAGYVKAGTRAAALAAASPKTSARQLARDGGISKDTLNRARSGAGSKEPAPPRKPAPRPASVERTRSAAAIAKNPEKSDREIARHIGVHHKVVGKARKCPVAEPPRARVVARHRAGDSEAYRFSAEPTIFLADYNHGTNSKTPPDHRLQSGA
jgi:hypothetical protein